MIGSSFSLGPLSELLYVPSLLCVVMLSKKEANIYSTMIEEILDLETINKDSEISYIFNFQNLIKYTYNHLL